MIHWLLDQLIEGLIAYAVVWLLVLLVFGKDFVLRKDGSDGERRPLSGGVSHGGQGWCGGDRRGRGLGGVGVGDHRGWF